MKTHQLFSHAILAMALGSTDAVACSCRTASLPERIAGAHIVLVAVVTDFSPLQQVIFKPKEVFKGQADATLTIPTGESDCDFFLPPVKPRIGDVYLLYVGQLDGRLFVSRCQNSGRIADRAAELADLRRRRWTTNQRG